jgi:adenine deaminase
MTVTYYHHLIDIHTRTIYPSCIEVAEGKIQSITPTDQSCQGFILPGLIDAHVHIESSMLIPTEFARLAVQHGTVATISDPHEIANVCGIDGVTYMLHNASKTPFKFHFGAPSCVPATAFESAGACIDAHDIATLMQRSDIYYLSEMMNYPGVLMKDEEVMKKIAVAHQYQKPVDGHAPGLRGEQAQQYIAAGISTDHECFTEQEALDKLKHGMKILIREGSAAKNFDALINLLHTYEDQIMFCCDDKHPDELVLHHINIHVKRAIAQGVDIFKVLRAACLNPVLHYGMDVGLLRVGDAADFIVIDSIENFSIQQTVINGMCVFESGVLHLPSIQETAINNFNCTLKSVSDFALVPPSNHCRIKVIEALEGQLITKTAIMQPKIVHNNVISDVSQDCLKMVVVNRYTNQQVAIAFLKNVGLQTGAIASTVAHDSHNIIAVGVDDASICNAVNLLVTSQGGIAVVSNERNSVLPLPVAGLMSTEPAEKVAAAYQAIDTEAKRLGCTLHSPFMTLSFMALLVIPQLKLSDKGLFDGTQFKFVDIFEVEK